jgi:hypothetical protein
MSDVTDLRAILADDGDAPSEPEAAAPEPTDGLPPETTSADEAPESDELSAEERVAELARADDEDPDAPSEDVPEPDADAVETEADEPEEDDDELQALIEEGRRARAEREWAEQTAPFQALAAERDAVVQRGIQHYEAEAQKAYEWVKDQARRSIDPDAYEATHMLPTLKGVERARDAWVRGKYDEYEGRAQQTQREAAKPHWARYLLEERRLPVRDDLVQRLLAVGDPDAMPAVADLMVEARNANATVKRRATKARKDDLAAQVRTNNIHPSGTGRPTNAQPVRLKSTVDEFRAIVALPD